MAHEIDRWRIDVDPDQDDVDLLHFALIASDSDGFFFYETELFKDPTIPAHLQGRFKELEAYYHDAAIVSAAAIVKRYGGAT